MPPIFSGHGNSLAFSTQISHSHFKVHDHKAFFKHHTNSKLKLRHIKITINRATCYIWVLHFRCIYSGWCAKIRGCKGANSKEKAGGLKPKSIRKCWILTDNQNNTSQMYSTWEIWEDIELQHAECPIALTNDQRRLWLSGSNRSGKILIMNRRPKNLTQGVRKRLFLLAIRFE